MGRLGRLLAAGLCALLATQAMAGFKGELDVEASGSRNETDSLDAAFGKADHWDQDLKLRLMGSKFWSSGWNLEAAYLVEARHGGGVSLARDLQASPFATIDPRDTAALRLEQTLSDDGRTQVTHRLDRLALGYSGTHLVLRLGRQALTWGGGLVFHPMDLFNPFPPNATDTAYKPGADMLYGQWLFDSGADLQGVAVPRRDPETGHLDEDHSSIGMKWHGFVGADQSLGIDLLAARDYRAQVLGLALSGSLGGATWTAELIPTRLPDGAVKTSLLANAQSAWEWGGKSVNGYLEFFRNGFGVNDEHTLAELPAPLSERLALGEIFTVSRNYLALGLEVQWTPLLTLKPSVIANLNDGSALLIAQAVYSLSQNTRLTAGLQWGVGNHGSEYGGLETAPGSGVFASPADLLYARVTWYF